MNSLKKITNKISNLKSVFTPADKYNELIDVLNTSDDYLYFLKSASALIAFSLTTGGAIKTKGVYPIFFRRNYTFFNENINVELKALSHIMYISNNDSPLTITITENIGDFIIANLNNYVNYTNNTFIKSTDDVTTFIGATFPIILNNIHSTSTNTLTLNLGTNTGLTVNGTDSLVVAAGTVGKFEVVITSATTAKVCRVY